MGRVREPRGRESCGRVLAAAARSRRLFAPVQFSISASDHGARLADALAARCPDADRVRLRGLVAAGRVSVNRMAADLRTRVRTGDLVEVSGLGDGGLGGGRRDVGDPEAGAPVLAILAEIDCALVVDKPAGMPSVPDRSGKEAGVHGQLAALRPDDDLRIAHRLDRDTSGCLILAKGLEGARALDAAFRAGEVHKRYVALVEGEVGGDELEIDESLGPDPKRPGRVRIVPAGSKRSRPARTGVRVVERFRRFTLVECRPYTGRSHQLRVHLQGIGHPIVADPWYGRREELRLSDFKPRYKARPGRRESALVTRTCLHAAAVEWTAPSGAELAATAPLPEDLASTLAKLRKFAEREGDGRARGSRRRGAPCD